MYVVLGECELVTGIEEEELTLNEREGIYTSPSMALTALHTRVYLCRVFGGHAVVVGRTGG